MKEYNLIEPPNMAYRTVKVKLLDNNNRVMPFGFIDIYYKWKPSGQYDSKRYQANVYGITEVQINQQWVEVQVVVLKPNGYKLNPTPIPFVGGVLGESIVVVSKYGIIEDIKP